MVQVLVHNLPAQIDVAGRAGLRPQLAEGGVAKVQARGALGIPPPVRVADAAALAAVADEERQRALDAVDRHHDALAAVLVQVAPELGVVHGHEVV